MCNEESTKLLSSSHFEMGQLSTKTYYPTHFMRGTVLNVNGTPKKVEDISSDDFLRCSFECKHKPIASVIEKIVKRGGTYMVYFIADGEFESCIQVQQEYPFFVLGKGWSSCDSNKTIENYGLRCSVLEEGDICIILGKYEDEDDDKLVSILDAETSSEQINEKMAQIEKITCLYEMVNSGRKTTPPDGMLTTRRQRNSTVP